MLDNNMLDNLEGISCVKFSATWCGPCKLMANIIEKIKKDFENIKFINIDIDDYPEFSKKYEIKSVPTVIFFKEGVELQRIQHLEKPDTIRRMLKDLENK